jgi:hypothetical protein
MENQTTEVTMNVTPQVTEKNVIPGVTRVRHPRSHLIGDLVQ